MRLIPFAAALILSTRLLAGAETSALFFDPSLPVHATPVDLGGGDVIVRGLLVRVGNDRVVFDQDLLRPAAWLTGTAGKEPLTLETMAQASWIEPTKKAGVNHPKPTGKFRKLAPQLPGPGLDVAGVMDDPRPDFDGDPGRGGLEESARRFIGYELHEQVPVLCYRVGAIHVREFYTLSGSTLLRHFDIFPGAELLFLVASGEFTLNAAGAARGGELSIGSNHPGLTLELHDGRVLARLAASAKPRRVTLGYFQGQPGHLAATPEVPTRWQSRWPETIETILKPAAKAGPGWALDQIELPNPGMTGRRMRPADVTFPSPGSAALVTFDGDVWTAEIAEKNVLWRRVAGGLSEPLSIASTDGFLQVFTRNGLVRLHDFDGDGEPDFYENHSSRMIQTASTRGYPLDMELDAAGRTFVSIGGIATDARGINNRAPGNPHSGALLMVSKDGGEIEVIASHSREPFFALDPLQGNLALSDQQGHWIPSSGIFPVNPGGSFGYGGQGGDILTPPVVWIPHEQDTSSASPLWMRGSAFKEWEGGLLNLSYGTGRLFLVRPGGPWPATRGAVIPLGIETDLPLLHGRTHPHDGSLWLVGFRIYDSRVAPLQGLARLRRTSAPLAVPVNAGVFAQGVWIAFDGAIDPASVDVAGVRARAWQYKRGSGYGSPRFKRDGSQGADALATGGVFLSKDGKSVFVHLPALQPTMQLELVHPFHLKGLEAGGGSLFFTAADLLPVPWVELGFDPPRLDDQLAGIHEAGDAAAVMPTPGFGLETVLRYGCTACHSDDGTQVGSGPSWKGVFGSIRKFTDGGSAKADAAYLREAILEPDKSIVEGYEVGMASYAGVLSEVEIESIILYLQTLE